MSRLEMRRQLGDLVAQPVQLRDGSKSSGNVWRVDLHGEPPSCWDDSTPAFRSHLGASRTGDSGTSDDFRPDRSRPPIAGSVRAAGPASAERSRHEGIPAHEAVKRKVQAASRRPG